MSWKGKFIPKNPNKYRGDFNNIIYRSSWEYKCMKKFDMSEKIIKWSSEEISIPYRSPVDNKIHKYFPDFWVKLNDGREILIEVKPNYQVKPPEKKKKITKKYINEVTTWGINEAKWNAAKLFCKQRGWSFLIQDEYDLGIKKRKLNG